MRAIRVKLSCLFYSKSTAIQIWNQIAKNSTKLIMATKEGMISVSFLNLFEIKTAMIMMIEIYVKNGPSHGNSVLLIHIVPALLA